MTDREQNDLQALLHQALDTITRLQARLDAAESLAVCLFAQLPRQDQHSVMDAVLDRTEAVAAQKFRYLIWRHTALPRRNCKQFC